MATFGGIWKKFLDLLPQEPRQVGDIVTVHSDGLYTVQVLGGGLIKVRGATGYVRLDSVFISGGLVESKASKLPTIEIEV